MYKKIQLRGMHLYSWLFHVPFDWHNNSVWVSSCPVDTVYVGLHDGMAIVSGINGFEQLA